MASAAFDAEAGAPAAAAAAGNGAHHAAKTAPEADAGAAFVLESKGTLPLPACLPSFHPARGRLVQREG